jgi:hypothetical protein
MRTGDYIEVDNDNVEVDSDNVDEDGDNVDVDNDYIDEDRRLTSTVVGLLQGSECRNQTPTPDPRESQIHSPCGNTPPNPVDKNRFDAPASDTCGKRRKSPSLFRHETRSFTPEGTAILSKPLQRDAEFFRTHLLLPLLTKKNFVLKEETWS